MMKQQNDQNSGQLFANLKSAIDEAAILVVTDKSGVITYVNQKFCSISKFSQSELIGKTHSLINSRFHPKDFFQQMWTTINTGEVWEGEIRNKAKDGTYYWVHTTIVPFLDQEGVPEQFVAVRYDITERKLADQRLKIYAKKLEASNKELQDFASIAAHDLQEPLRKIQAFSDRLKTKFPESISSEALDYLGRIQSSAGRMQVLINDLLTYSRVTTQAKPFLTLDLNQVIANAVSDLEVQLEKNNGKVIWNNLPSIEADSTQMHQLFQNIIGNALKFSKKDEAPVITIDAQIVKPSSLGRPGSACIIKIQDNGIGFDEKYLDRIFTIFQRLHGRDEYEGTGIGLAVCRKILDRHGGVITASSVLGRGSTFVVTLPTKQNSGETQ